MALLAIRILGSMFGDDTCHNPEQPPHLAKPDLEICVLTHRCRGRVPGSSRLSRARQKGFKKRTGHFSRSTSQATDLQERITDLLLRSLAALW
jgi:hypothetical protein